MAERRSSIDLFNTAMKPIESRARQFDSGTIPGTMKDNIIAGTTEGGVPQTEAQQKIEAGNKFQKPIRDAIPGIALGAWNSITPESWRKGSTNYWIETQADIDQRRVVQEQNKLYREKIDRVGNDILMMAETAKNQFQKTGDAKYLDTVVQAKNDIFNNEKLTDDHFVSISDDTFGLADQYGLFTNAPNPYPMIEAIEKMGLGTYGMIKGQKLMNKHYVERFLKGAAKGSHQKKTWLAKTAGAVLGGASAVAVADYGNEFMLDLQSRAGQAQKWMEDDNIRVGMWDAMLGTAMPESWTFGGEGINRPGLDQRKKMAFEAFAWDAAITSAFFGARPLYYGTRKLIGLPFKMFKPKPSIDPSIVKATDLLAAEQSLIEKYMDKDVLKALNLKAPTEKLDFNVPLVGNFLWKATNSNMPFNPLRWMGPSDPIKKGSDEWWPDAVEIGGTNLGRQMVGGQLAPGIAATMSPAPLFGSGIRNNMANQGDFYLQAIGRSMLGKFAPYAGVKDMALDWTTLAGANTRGFQAEAKRLEKIFDDSAMGAGKVFTDRTMVTIGKQSLREFREKLQLDMEGNLIPQSGTDKVINFIEKQIILPVGESALNTHSMRSLSQMKGIREELDKLIKPLKDDTLAQTSYADTVTRLMQAWETDMGSVSKMGYPEVKKAWEDYEKFVSNGMLLWMTNVGQAVNKISTRGFDVVLEKDATRAGAQLFETVVAAAKSKPGSYNSYQELNALKRIVGPRAYHNGVGRYIGKVFDESITEKSGLMYFDGKGFKSKLGIGEEGSALKALMEDALSGPAVAKLKIFDPATGIFKEFDDELYAQGTKQGLKQMLKEEVPDEFLKAENRQLPTIKEFQDLANIFERLFINGVPDPSKFMMRRAIMTGTRSSLRALLPTSALGRASQHGTSKGENIALGGSGFLGGPITAAAIAWFINYGGKVLTSRVSLRVFNTLLDPNINSTVRLANFNRFVRMYPEEWSEFDKDLAELEVAERMNTDRKFASQQAKTTGAKIREGINSAAENISGGVGKVIDAGKSVGGSEKFNPNVFNLMTPDKPEIPDTEMKENNLYAPYDSGNLGSSITQNPTMNPAAAASLYQGNTDAALANQYGGGTQFAAGGGIMNAVMDNKGKFTEIQKGINDNPFTKSMGSS